MSYNQNMKLTYTQSVIEYTNYYRLNDEFNNLKNLLFKLYSNKNKTFPAYYEQTEVHIKKHSPASVDKNKDLDILISTKIEKSDYEDIESTFNREIQELCPKLWNKILIVKF